MQQFVEQERPGRAEFMVVRDMVLKKLTDELRAAGWTVAADEEADYLGLAAQLAEQTQPLVQEDAKQARAQAAQATPESQGGAASPAAVQAPALGSVAAAAAAAAAAEKAAAPKGGASTPGSKGYDLNSTLQGLQEMRARLEARKQKRAVEGTVATPTANPSPATSAYQKALLNLKASMSKHGEVGVEQDVTDGHGVCRHPRWRWQRRAGQPWGWWGGARSTGAGAARMRRGARRTRTERWWFPRYRVSTTCYFHIVYACSTCDLRHACDAPPGICLYRPHACVSCATCICTLTT